MLNIQCHGLDLPTAMSYREFSEELGNYQWSNDTKIQRTRNIKLRVISLEMTNDRGISNRRAERSCIENEENRTQDRNLWKTVEETGRNPTINKNFSR